MMTPEERARARELHRAVEAAAPDFRDGDEVDPDAAADVLRDRPRSPDEPVAPPPIPPR